LGLIFLLSKGSLKTISYLPLIDFKNMLIFHVKILMLDHKIQHFTTQKLMVIILSLFFMAKNHIKKEKEKEKRPM